MRVMRKWPPQRSFKTALYLDSKHWFASNHQTVNTFAGLLSSSRQMAEAIPKKPLVGEQSNGITVMLRVHKGADAIQFVRAEHATR